MKTYKVCYGTYGDIEVVVRDDKNFPYSINYCGDVAVLLTEDEAKELLIVLTKVLKKKDLELND
jgi:hypothetical protein